MVFIPNDLFHDLYFQTHGGLIAFYTICIRWLYYQGCPIFWEVWNILSEYRLSWVEFHLHTRTKSMIVWTWHDSVRKYTFYYFIIQLRMISCYLVSTYITGCICNYRIIVLTQWWITMRTVTNPYNRTNNVSTWVIFMTIDVLFFGRIFYL